MCGREGRGPQEGDRDSLKDFRSGGGKEIGFRVKSMIP